MAWLGSEDEWVYIVSSPTSFYTDTQHHLCSTFHVHCVDRTTASHPIISPHLMTSYIDHHKVLNKDKTTSNVLQAQYILVNQYRYRDRWPYYLIRFFLQQIKLESVDYFNFNWIIHFMLEETCGNKWTLLHWSTIFHLMYLFLARWF